MGFINAWLSVGAEGKKCAYCKYFEKSRTECTNRREEAKKCFRLQKPYENCNCPYFKKDTGFFSG